jgi:glycosyltransferase involved in cell wall biosynthesis
VHALIVGGDEVSYGKAPAGARHWREKMLGEVKLDAQRTHFLGRVPRARYIQVLQVSAAHVYLTYPFVLSWSLLEAMACGANLVVSDTAPLKEVIRPGKGARVVPFHGVDELARGMSDALGAYRHSREWQLMQAEIAAARYGRDAGLRGYEQLIGLPSRAAVANTSEPNDAKHATVDTAYLLE